MFQKRIYIYISNFFTQQKKRCYIIIYTTIPFYYLLKQEGKILHSEALNVALPAEIFIEFKGCIL